MNTHTSSKFATISNVLAGIESTLELASERSDSPDKYRACLGVLAPLAGRASEAANLAEQQPELKHLEIRFLHLKSLLAAMASIARNCPLGEPWEDGIDVPGLVDLCESLVFILNSEIAAVESNTYGARDRGKSCPEKSLQDFKSRHCLNLPTLEQDGDESDLQKLNFRLRDRMCNASLLVGQVEGILGVIAHAHEIDLDTYVRNATWSALKLASDASGLLSHERMEAS